MSDDAISISLTEEERLFVDRQIASGNYSDDAAILRAGLAALERERKQLDSRQMIFEAAAAFDGGEFRAFDDDDDLARHIARNAVGLRRELADAEARGESRRRVPDIMNAVKTKLRADGAL